MYRSAAPALKRCGDVCQLYSPLAGILAKIQEFATEPVNLTSWLRQFRAFHTFFDRLITLTGPP
jgi:hypothetical protein